MKPFAILLTTLVVAGTAALGTDPYPATVTVEGRVTDAATGRPLENAQISMDLTGALSNAEGRYTLSLSDAWIGQEITVKVTLIGYAAREETLTLSAGANALDVAMQSTALRLSQLVVTGQASERARTARAEAPAVASDILLRGPRSGAGDANVALARTIPMVDPGLDREAYAHIEENDWRAVTTAPLSTFSIDVDRASYANVRRFLTSGRLPPVDAVRIEELINYFPFEDPAPTGAVPFAVTAEVGTAPWQPQHYLVRVGLKAREVDTEDLPPSNLVFLLDVSGSMNNPDKLPLLKTAFGMLIEQLRPQDRVAIVVYAGAAGLVLESTPGHRKADILEAISRLDAGGSTAGGAGIRLAYDVAERAFIRGGNNRVILATDGDFNVGASSDSEMIRLIEEKRESGVFLTVLGFGTGNLQDAKMEQIADHGNGAFNYIDSAKEARKVLVSEMGGTLLTVAKDVKIQVEFNPEQVQAYRLIGYENRLLADEDFADDTKDAGELGAGHSVTALYEVIPAGVNGTAEVRLPESLRYQPATVGVPGSARGELLFVKLRYKAPDEDESQRIDVPLTVDGEVGEGSDRLRFAAAVAAWGMHLRDSEHMGHFDLEAVRRLADESLGSDLGGLRAEFLELVDASLELKRAELARR